MSEFPYGWKRAKLRELIREITAGQSPNRMEHRARHGKKGILKTTAIQWGKFDPSENLEALPGFSANENTIVRKDDILITKAGPSHRVGVVALSTEDSKTLHVSGKIAILRVNETVDPTFLAHQISHYDFQRQLLGDITGMAQSQTNFTHENLLSKEVLLPPLPEQKKIAEILSGIDNAISTKEEILAKRERVSELLAVDLLNANKKEEMAFLADIATLHRGKFSHRPRNDPSFYGGDIPFVQTGDIPKKGVRISEFNQTLNQKGLGVSRLFPKGTLVITIAATIGEVGILDFSACFPDSLVGIAPLKEKCNPIYLLFALRHFKKDLLQLAPQSAQSNLNLEILGKYPVPLPPMTIQNQIADVVINQERENDSRSRYIAKLRFLKQAMTENLLSGRKRVSV